MVKRLVATFLRGGIHPDPHKEATRDLPVVDFPASLQVTLPLIQHLGAPAVPLVKKGDVVRRGQKIADSPDSGAPLHATISGKVKNIDRHPHPTLAISQAIVIARSAEEPLVEEEWIEDPNWQECPPAEILARVREAGIVGLGGAAFPTWRKLTLPPDARVDVLVLNGAECEPFLTSDFRLMVERPREVLEGALVIARAIDVYDVRIGIESDKGEALERMGAELRRLPASPVEISLVSCATRYPQGAEKQLVQATTGRLVPLRCLPSAVGVLVQNVATAAAVREAVRFRRPLMDLTVCVTGPGVMQPRNVRAPIGTQLQELVDFCGGSREGTSRVIAGGPMMGRSLPRLDVPLVKGMNGLVLLTGPSPYTGGYDACVHCGRCLEACPLGLEPDQVGVYVEAGRQVETETFGALDCYECGCCTYACPSHRPLVQFMQVAKSAVRRSQAAKVLKG